MRYFFISTKHLEQRLWFKDSEDFKAGMNYVAVVVAMTDIEKSEYIKSIRWRFSTDINQICRILGISYQEASGLLDLVL